MILDDLKRLREMVKERDLVIGRLSSRIEELTIQLADAQIACRLKDKLIAEREVEISDIKKRLRNISRMG